MLTWPLLERWRMDVGKTIAQKGFFKGNRAQRNEQLQENQTHTLLCQRTRTLNYTATKNMKKTRKQCFLPYDILAEIKV